MTLIKLLRDDPQNWSIGKLQTPGESQSAKGPTSGVRPRRGSELPLLLNRLCQSKFTRSLPVPYVGALMLARTVFPLVWFYYIPTHTIS